MRFVWENPKYIVDTTRSVVGETTLWKLRTGGAVRNPRPLYLLLKEKIELKMSSFGADKLGIISSYGTHNGFHNGGPLDQTHGFMNLTGFKDVLPNGFEAKNGIDRLLEMAVATIVCIAFDIIYQGDYDMRRHREREEEHLWERCGHEMTHGKIN